MTPITDTQADAILTILSHEYDRNPSPFVGLMEELRILGQVEVPEGSFERVRSRTLAAHPVEVDSPVSPCSGIAGHAPSNPGLRAGTSLPGLRPVSPPDTAPAPVFTAGVGVSGVVG